MNGYEEKMLETTTNTRAELNDIYDPIIQSTLNDKTTFYGVLTKEANIGGDYARWRVRTGRNTSADSYGETDTITTGNAARAKLSTPIKLIKVGWDVSGLMIEANKGASGIGDILSEEIKDATSDMLVEISTQLFGDGTGNGGKDINGLKNTVDDGVLYPNIYGLARATNTWLNATVKDMAAATLALTDLREMIQAAEKAGAKKSDLVFVTSYKQKDVILNYIQATQMYIPTSARFGIEGQPSFDGIPIFTDQFCDDDYVYLIDMNVTMLKVTLAPTVNELPTSTDSKSGYIKTYFELICKAPTHNVKYYNFA